MRFSLTALLPPPHPSPHSLRVADNPTLKAREDATSAAMARVLAAGKARQAEVSCMGPFFCFARAVARRLNLSLHPIHPPSQLAAARTAAAAAAPAPMEEVTLTDTAPALGVRSGRAGKKGRGGGKGRNPALAAGGLNEFHPKPSKGKKRLRKSIFNRH